MDTTEVVSGVCVCFSPMDRVKGGAREKKHGFRIALVLPRIVGYQHPKQTSVYRGFFFFCVTLPVSELCVLGGLSGSYSFCDPCRQYTKKKVTGVKKEASQP